MSEAAREYIRQAITDFWGERCDIHDEDCPTCMVWAEFDRSQPVQETPKSMHVEGDVHRKWKSWA